jgi:uncharacterized protein YraI
MNLFRNVAQAAPGIRPASVPTMAYRFPASQYPSTRVDLTAVIKSTQDRPTGSAYFTEEKMKTKIISTILGCAVGVPCAMAIAAPAANAATGRVITSGVNLTVRSGPGPSYNEIGKLAPGTVVSFGCYEQGAAETGPYGTETIWDHLDSGGFVSDAWIYTGSNSTVVPECSTPTIPNSQYNRSAAVAWALANANDPQAFPAECTWFVSNALWQGGFAQTDAWTSSGSHGTWPVTYRPGTADAWAVSNFKDYFLSHYSATWTLLGNMSVNAVPSAEPGDIIVYSWDGGKTLDHMAFVVSIASGQYPVVSEWGTPDWTPLTYVYYAAHHPREGYQYRGWTWSQKNNEYLQIEKNGQARAYLLHINGGYFAPTF